MKTIIVTSSNQQTAIVEAIAVLQLGGIVIYPTETCYGVAVDATNPEAIKKLLVYKERPIGKAISIAVTDRTMAEKYVEVNETAENLYKNFLPGPVTVISQSLHSVAPGIEAEDGSLGIRVPDYTVTLELIKQFGKPITATSANISSKKTPYTIHDILDNASEKNKKLIDLIIDAGELPHNPPSTVVDTRLNDMKTIRQGQLSFTNKNAQTVISHSEKETQQLASKLMKNMLSQLKNNCVIFALQGEMGAGKTQFAKGVARALEITETITSPTFTIVNEYQFTKDTHGTFYHIDTWRMFDEKELLDLGFEKMVKPGNVIVVEWMEKIQKLISRLNNNNEVYMMKISITDTNKLRKIVILHE